MTRRWFPLLALAVVAYLAWRLVSVIQTPTLAGAALLAVEVLAWLGFGAFRLRVTPPSRQTPVHDDDAAVPPVVVAVLGAGRPQAGLERSILSLDPSRAQVFIVDDGSRDPTDRVAVDDLATSAQGSVVVAKGEGMAAAVVALGSHVDDDDVLVLLEAGSVLASTAIDALLAPMRDPSVGAVQGAIAWADSSTLNSNAPSREGLDLFVTREASAAGDAGVAPITGNGSAVRVRALRDVVSTSGDLGLALNAHGWTTRFSTATAAFRRPPISSVEWRALRTSTLAAQRRRAWGALFARNIRPAPRARVVAGFGDIASAFARVGALVMVVFALLSGTVPVPGPLGVTIVVSAVLWAFAALATRIAVAPVLRFGDRMRLGWHRLDADALAAFVPAGTRANSAHPGRLRALAAFPLSVMALVVIDAAGIVRALTLIDPGIVAPISTTLERAAIGVATLASLALLFDALRIFVARPDARDDLRVRTAIQATLTFSDGRTNVADIVDLSSIGAGLMTDAPVARGDRVHLHFELPGRDNPIDVVITAARIEGEGSARLVGAEFGRLDPITRTALLRYVATNPPVREDALPAASAFPRVATMPVPRPVLRFASVLTVIVVTTALLVGTAVAAPTSEAFLTGTVSGPSGPVANICVSAQSDSWNWYGTQTDDSGSFTLPVPSDTYRIQYRDCRSGATDRFTTGWWSAAGVVNANDAARVTVGDGETSAALDATLQPGGWFTATLQDAAGLPLDGICINPVSVTTNNWDGGQTSPAQGGAAGSAETDALLAGQYRIHFNDCSQRAEPIAQGFLGPDGVSLVPFQDAGKVFDVAGSPIDLGTITLPHGTRLTGTVHDDTGAPIERVCVSVQSQNWNWVGGTQTAADGTYVTDPILPGNWVISFQDCRDTHVVVNTFWTGTDAVISDINAATPIAVDSAQSQQGPYDQVMMRGGTITGSVTGDNGPISGACVNAVHVNDNNWQWFAGTQSGPDGTFTLGPVLGDNITIDVNQCNSSTSIIEGVYAGPDAPLTRNTSQAVTVNVGVTTPITGLVLRPQLGTLLSGTVRTNATPLADVCMSIVDPATGYAESQNTSDDGQWSVTVPPGSFVVEALDCSPGRGYVGKFFTDATDPSQATRVIATGEPQTNLDINLAAGTPTSIIGRVVTGAGDIPAACAVAVTPNHEPAAIVQTGADGSFDLGPLNPGSYMVGLAGCDFSQDQPPGITDPVDPSIVYPLQWSTGTPLDFTNIWVDPPWVTAASGTPRDLGTICLKPCNVPETTTTTTTTTTTEPPTTTTTTAPATSTSGPDATTPTASTTAPPATTAPPVTTVPSTPPPATTPPAPRPPIVGDGSAAFVRSELPGVAVPPVRATTAPASATQQALRSIPPPAAPPGKVVQQVDVHGATVTRTPTAAPATFTRKANTPTTSGGSASWWWWWLFVAAGVIGLGAAMIPWYRAWDGIAQPVSTLTG